MVSYDERTLREAAARALPCAPDDLAVGRTLAVVLRSEPAFAPWVRIEVLAPDDPGTAWAVRRSTWRMDVDAERTRLPNVSLDGSPTIEREARALAARGWGHLVAAVADAAQRCGEAGDVPLRLDATLFHLELGAPARKTWTWDHALPAPWRGLRRPLAELVAAVDRALADRA